MAGRKPTTKKPTAAKEPVATLHCSCCKQDWKETEFYSSTSSFFNGRLPICKSCIETNYKQYFKKYKEDGYANPERDAIRRICMAIDIYYSDVLFEKAKQNMENSQKEFTVISAYLKIVKLNPYGKKTYDDTIAEENGLNVKIEFKDDESHVSDKTIAFFGNGFSAEDYTFLQKEYDDWTARHECNTKSQEEVFKQICFSQLRLLKAERSGVDTKDLNTMFLKQLEVAKLQPKQNKGDTTSETQTFGTLIDKWENTRPIPEVDPELKDVDRIGLYLDVFFRGHLAKMMGLKNGLSNLYDRYMRKYTVSKPEINDDSEGEAVFDAIFGNQSLIDEDD